MPTSAADPANHLALTIAREARGLTQSALAEQSGVSQATISKIESGQLAATPEVIEKLAGAVSFPVTFFYQAVDYRQLPATFYRKRVTGLSQRIVRSLRAKLNIFRQQLRLLVAPAELPEVRLPVLDLQARHMSAAMAAREVRRAWNLPPGPIDNLTRVLEAAGVLIFRWDFGTARVDGFSFYETAGDLPPIIFVNQVFPTDRDRYTVAHELAHLVAHVHLPFVTAESRDIEDEADEFAAELLMPSSDIKGHLLGVSVERLATMKPYWKTSMAALLVRAHSLGLLSQSQYQPMWQRIAPYRTVEPNPLPPEEPTLLGQLIDLHLKQLGFRSEQLVDLLRCDPAFFRQHYWAPSLGLRLVM